MVFRCVRVRGGEEKGGEEERRGTHLLLSGERTRAAEDEDRRLLRTPSPGCLRFKVDVERLSTTGRGRGTSERNTQTQRGGGGLGLPYDGD